MRIRSIVVASTLALACATAFAQAYVPLEKRLSAQQMRDTGVDQLTPAQLAALNAILGDERVIERRKMQAELPAAKPAREPVEGRIAGTFRGWSPGQVLTLEGGERWQVVEGEITVKPLQSPMVRIKPGLVGAFYMTVDGVPTTAKVRRAK